MFWMQKPITLAPETCGSCVGYIMPQLLSDPGRKGNPFWGRPLFSQAALKMCPSFFQSDAMQALCFQVTNAPLAVRPCRAKRPEIIWPTPKRKRTEVRKHKGKRTGCGSERPERIWPSFFLGYSLFLLFEEKSKGHQPLLWGPLEKDKPI